MSIQVRLCGDSTVLQNIKKFLTRYKVSPGELYSPLLMYVCYESRVLRSDDFGQFGRKLPPELSSHFHSTQVTNDVTYML